MRTTVLVAVVAVTASALVLAQTPAAAGQRCCYEVYHSNTSGYTLLLDQSSGNTWVWDYSGPAGRRVGGRS